MKRIISIILTVIILSSVCIIGIMQTNAASVATPAVTSIANAEGGIKLTWNKVSGAYQYRVFIKSGSSWKGVGYTKSNAFLYDVPKENTKYTFTVRACNSSKSYVSSYNKTGWSITYIATPYIQAEKTNITNSGITVSWNKVSGAYQYRVFIKSGSSWKGVGYTKSNAFTYSNVKKNSNYIFTVRACNNSKKYVSSYEKTGTVIRYSANPTVTCGYVENNYVGFWYDAINDSQAYRIFVYNGTKWIKLADTTNKYYSININNVTKYAKNYSGEKRIYFTMRGMNSAKTKYTTNFNTLSSGNAFYVVERQFSNGTKYWDTK